MPRKKKKETPVIVWKTAYEVMQERKELKRLSTGTALDELIGGGIQQTEVAEFYGPYGSGKSQLSMTMTVLVAAEGGEVIYIDAENTFKPERVMEIAEKRSYDPNEIVKHIHLAQPLTTDELMAIIDQIPKDLKPTLVIVDSITSLYREEYIGRNVLTARQGALRQFIVKLKKYVRENKCYSIVTNQVYDVPDALPNMPLYIRQQAVGGHTHHHTIDNRIFLRKAPGGTRIGRLVDSSMYPEQERTFIITDRGIEPVKQEETEQPAE